MSPATTRDALAAHLEEQARWRLSKAEEFPEDHRNLKWAGTLNELAKWVRALSPRHPDLVRLDKVWGVYGLDIFGVTGAQSSQLTSRPAVDQNQGAQWLREFVDAYIEEEAEAGADVGVDLLLDWAQDTDPAIALPALRRLHYRLEEWEEEAVIKARVESMPWSRVGQLLGRSKQNVWEKHRDPGESLGDETAEQAG